MSAYIVAFKKGTAQGEIDKAAAEVEKAGGTITQRYSGAAMTGFAASNVPESHVQTLQTSFSETIAFVEPDGQATTQ